MPQAKVSGEEVGSTTDDSGRPKVLIVDDTPQNRIAFEAALASAEYDILTASSGEEALRALLQHTCAVILMDVAMPGMDGYETARRIRERERTRGVPILFVTAHMGDAEQVFRGYAEGAVDYLVKPVDIHALRAKVSVFVDLFVQRQLVASTLGSLREAERRERVIAQSLYDVTFEEAPIGIGHVQMDGTWLRANERLAKLFGMTLEELQARRLVDLVHPDDRSALGQHVASVAAGTQPKHKAQYRLLHANGDIVWVALTCSLLRDIDGAPVHLAIIEDLSEEKRLATELESSERRFARLCDSGLLGVFHEEHDGTISSANDAFLGMTGYGRSDLEAHRFKLSLFEGEPTDEAALAAREELHQKGYCAPFVHEFARRDGRTGVMLTGAVANGGAIGFALDVTAIREAATVRARTLRELEDSVRARDDFLAVVSHELRTPLTPLMMQIARLRDGASPEGDQTWLRRQIETLERYARRVESLVLSLLDVSELRLGRLPLELEDVDLVELTRSVLRRAERDLERAGCATTLVGDARVVGTCDRVRIEQVLQNLLSNAMKFGVGRPIELAVVSRDRHARLSVRDHGPGIDPGDHEHIFDRFGRRAQVQSHGGFGLGLWTAREIVRAHGGRIEFEDAPGGGACFRVYLPRETAAASPS